MNLKASVVDAIGNTPFGGGFPFIGLIDEVLLYSRALSSQEVQTLAAIPPTPPSTRNSIT